MKPIKFRRTDVGTFADSTFGHEHIRSRLHGLIKSVAEGFNAESDSIIDSLEGPMPADAWDEDAAIELLNEYCEPGVFFELSEGDLVLKWEMYKNPPADTEEE